MKQTSSIISTYSADVFGVCSALYELGGLVVMHDASGCNSTYSTHDEPRWYTMDSMVYISALSEMEAVMGDDNKLIEDITEAAESLKPKFVAICGTPIPAMIGFDFEAVAKVLEDRLKIPVFGIPTSGMNTYVKGANMALSAFAERIPKENVKKTIMPSINILGLTPLDFSINGQAESICNFASSLDFDIISKWTMGTSFEDIEKSGSANINLVVSSTGLEAAKVLKKRFATPYVVGTPIEGIYNALLADTIKKVYTDPDFPDYVCKSNLPGEDIVVIGEAITSISLASSIELACGKGVRILCPTEIDKYYLRDKDKITPYEDDIRSELTNAKMIIADPLYKAICPDSAKFIPLPSESFSGRIYRDEIPDLTSDFSYIKKYL